jgi:hypothetical protein
MPPNIPQRQPIGDTAYIRVDDKNFVSLTAKAVDSYSGHPVSSARHKRAAGSRDLYSNYDTNTSVRNQFSRSDYEFFRPNETLPTAPLDIINASRSAYRKVGIIRNVVDLMADFGCQGAHLVHPNPTIQKFYRGWWKKIDGDRISERFLNLLYREAITVIKRTMAKLPKSKAQYIQSMGGKETLTPDIEFDEPLKTQNRNIPLRYNFLNPLSLEAVGGELASFVGKSLYSLKVSSNLRRAVKHPKTDADRQLIELLPADIKTAILSGAATIPLDPNKVMSFFYKKDDWEAWADPMIYAIMDDIMLLEKMKLADLAALDSAISQIRIWKLGHINDAHPDMSIFPTDVAINKLNEVLLSNPGCGAFDVIWGPELELSESSTNIHEFLGKEKYEPVWNAIYEGLGVPPTLTGSSTSKGMTNNSISLKTLIQRLEYGRTILRKFWEQELELVRQAMSFKESAMLVFDNMVLSDEAAEKALLIQLIDRDIISLETVLERFGELPEFEELRLRREEKSRKSGKIKSKAGPWHTPEKIFEFMKLALQRGYIAPEQTGMTEEFPAEFLDVETPFEQQLKIAEQKTGSKTGPDSKESKKDVSGKGRPKNAKDSYKRSRTPKPLGDSAEDLSGDDLSSNDFSGDFAAAYLTAFMWAKSAQQEVADIVNPVFLKYCNKTSVRALSAKQAKDLENVKFNTLCCIQPYSLINKSVIKELLAPGKLCDDKYHNVYNTLYHKALSQKGSELTMDEVRLLQVMSYASLNSDTELIHS